ncbi:MAG: 3-deoxy-8-phosphooctulonate synthase [Deltaproteobacteria bacterium]|nr:MAG: 3-deoxy-8-phosphooctulonate synthase [Deltaproteobacteria bacterium]PIE74935.1 MAG: 3-deoxy-8-phosphooctulonate synthase [Deltaproteobacteria bacterium]
MINILKKQKLFIIAGPCVIESREILFLIASKLKEIKEKENIEIIFKASFDKANRTSIKSFRGPGKYEGLKYLEEIKNRFSLPVISDIHLPQEADIVKDVLDIIQIPAFLCRQTDLIAAASRTGLTINIKKGQFLAPWDVKNIIEKAKASGNDKIIITERGSSFGYNNLVVDFRGIPIIKKMGVPVVFDATHSVQIPGGYGESSSGERDMAPVLARSAVAAGADGVFMEIHPDPDNALCDGPNSIYLSKVESIIKTLIKIKEAVNE